MCIFEMKIGTGKISLNKYKITYFDFAMQCVI